jgi:hypothetical protein
MALRGDDSGAWGINRINLDRMSPGGWVTMSQGTFGRDGIEVEGKASPIEGPPVTRIISLDEPPSSDTGRT